MNQILIPISPGELLDKITILEIKSERIESAEKKANVNKELGMLNTVWADAVTQDAEIIAMRAELKSINENLWDIEDDIRDEERAKRFSEKFIELAEQGLADGTLPATNLDTARMFIDSDIRPVL